MVVKMQACIVVLILLAMFTPARGSAGRVPVEQAKSVGGAWPDLERPPPTPNKLDDAASSAADGQPGKASEAASPSSKSNGHAAKEANKAISGDKGREASADDNADSDHTSAKEDTTVPSASPPTRTSRADPAIATTERTQPVLPNTTPKKQLLPVRVLLFRADFNALLGSSALRQVQFAETVRAALTAGPGLLAPSEIVGDIVVSRGSILCRVTLVSEAAATALTAGVEQGQVLVAFHGVNLQAEISSSDNTAMVGEKSSSNDARQVTKIVLAVVIPVCILAVMVAAVIQKTRAKQRWTPAVAPLDIAGLTAAGNIMHLDPLPAAHVLPYMETAEEAHTLSSTMDLRVLPTCLRGTITHGTEQTMPHIGESVMHGTSNFYGKLGLYGELLSLDSTAVDFVSDLTLCAEDFAEPSFRSSDLSSPGDIDTLGGQTPLSSCESGPSSTRVLLLPSPLESEGSTSLLSPASSSPTLGPEHSSVKTVPGQLYGSNGMKRKFDDGIEDVNARNVSGQTPLMLACQQPAAGIEIENVVQLLKRGADPNLLDAEGASALQLAARHGSCEVIQVLLKAGADPTFKDSRGMTSLMHAATNDHREVVALLARKRAIDVNARDMNGWTALHWAVAVQALQTVKTLLSLHKLEVCVVNDANETVLHLAARSGNLEIVRALLKQSAPHKAGNLMAARTCFRESALDYALARNHAAVVDYLRQACPLAGWTAYWCFTYDSRAFYILTYPILSSYLHSSFFYLLFATDLGTQVINFPALLRKKAYLSRSDLRQHQKSAKQTAKR